MRRRRARSGKSEKRSSGMKLRKNCVICVHAMCVLNGIVWSMRNLFIEHFHMLLLKRNCRLCDGGGGGAYDNGSDIDANNKSRCRNSRTRSYSHRFQMMFTFNELSTCVYSPLSRPRSLSLPLSLRTLKLNGFSSFIVSTYTRFGLFSQRSPPKAFSIFPFTTATAWLALPVLHCSQCPSVTVCFRLRISC